MEKSQNEPFKPHTKPIITDSIIYAYNIKALKDTNTQIIKGLQAGTDTKTLLLMAVQGIDLLQGTNALTDQVKATYNTIYTEALHDKDTTRLDLLEAQKRLERLQNAKPESVTDRTRIKQAIARHEKLINRYNAILNE